jgi:predicted HAD superfamily Cof-like phosphohydrolase
MKTVEMVKEFHQAFDHSIRSTPGFPTGDEVEFRYNFIREELNEMIDSYHAGDLVEFADALGDIQYVLDGLFLNAGLHDKKQEIVAEIHKSNMSKLCKDMKEAEATVANLLLTHEGGYKFTISPVGEYFVVKRGDGKVMKSIKYFKPDLRKIIDPNFIEEEVGTTPYHPDSFKEQGEITL